MPSTNRRPGATARTIAVLLASAAAEEDWKWLRRLAERRFEFQLLAAATQDVPLLPREGWHDLQRLLKVHATAEGAEIRLSIQAEGYAALRRVAGRAGRLSSANGVLNVRFRFDGSGNAFAALQADPAVYQALTEFQLLLDESDEP